MEAYWPAPAGGRKRRRAVLSAVLSWREAVAVNRAYQAEMPASLPARPSDMSQGEHRRAARLLTTFYGAVVLADRLGLDLDDLPTDEDQADREPSLSLANGEKVPTCDFGKAQDHPTEYEYVRQSSPEREALLAAKSRSRERQRKVLALIQAGEPAHAKRLAECRRKSVRLECPEMAGGCGSDENMVPVSCDSRLCPECMRARQGELTKKYAPVVAEWDHPTMFRLGSPKRVEPEEIERAVDALRGAFGRLRRRVIPPDGDGYTWSEWKAALRAVGRTDLARRWQKRYVDQRKGIPFSEVVSAGFYGIDIKQGEDGTVNVHGHVLADIPWLPQAALSELWGAVHAAPVVDIRRVKGRNGNDMEDAVMEVVGYAAKPPEFESHDDEAEYLTALKGSKLIQPFGELHGNTPDVFGMLRCCDCERSPRYWNYLEVVDGCHETAIIGDGTRGENDPPGESDA